MNLQEFFYEKDIFGNYCSSINFINDGLLVNVQSCRGFI